MALNQNTTKQQKASAAQQPQEKQEKPKNLHQKIFLVSQNTFKMSDVGPDTDLTTVSIINLFLNVLCLPQINLGRIHESIFCNVAIFPRHPSIPKNKRCI